MYTIPIDKIKGLVIDFDVQKFIVLTINDSILKTGGQIVVPLYHSEIAEFMHMEEVMFLVTEVSIYNTMKLSLDGLEYHLVLFWHERTFKIPSRVHFIKANLLDFSHWSSQDDSSEFSYYFKCVS